MIPEWLRIRRGPQQALEDAAQWTKCPKCATMLYRPDLAKNLFVCTTCKYHFRMHAFDRISMLVDANFIGIGDDVLPGDPLGWTDKTPYPQKLERDREKSKLTEGVVCGFASIGEIPVALGVMDFNFRGGTMGTVVGERLARLFEGARERKLPLVVCTASGGARMEEGMLALMQMAKTTVALQRFRDDGGYAITVLTDPTTGGVSASFAFQADVIVSEARASIGFAGRRVIEQTIRQKLPDNFQTAEFLLEHGAIDMVVERAELKALLTRLLDYGVGDPQHFIGAGERARFRERSVVNAIVERERGLLELEERIADLKKHAVDQPVDLSAEIRVLEEKYAQIQQEIFSHLTPWQRVNMARHPKRPLGSAYLAALDQFDELHGDRHFGDDPAIIGGFAKLRGRRIVAIAQDKGVDTKDKVHRNFGMPRPEGYRKVLRLVQLAGHLGLPIVTFVDTSGADPGIASEERAQAEAIAQSIAAFAEAPVPIVSTIIGEGGSGGALALALADHVTMLEHSVYSVASPEGCAAILWGDAGKAEEAAARLRLTSDDLKGFGIIDEIVPEPLGGAHRDPHGTIGSVLSSIDGALARLATVPSGELRARRYDKFRRIGAPA